MIAHDLRLPLAALRLASELALDGEAEPSEQHYLLETVQRQVGALERLTLDLLDAFADGKSAARGSQEIDVEALCREVVAEFDAALGAGRAIVLCVQSGVRVHGDAAKLRVAVRNLIGNAAKYSPAGASVTVSVAQRGSRVFIGVRDHGAGIAAEHLDRIFERDYRIDRGEGGAPGHGLGLHMARAIVAAHGGEISVESATGAGSCFTIALPAAV